MTAINESITKPIKIHWTAPNRREYEDIVRMTQEEYKKFVNDLLILKQQNNVKVEL